MKLRRHIYIGLSVICFAKSVLAYNLPPVNLGNVGFLDAVPPSPNDGWYIIQRISGYDAQTFTDGKGKPLNAVPSPGFNPYYSFTQISYISPKTTLFHAHLGVTMVVPVVLAYNLQTPNALGFRANSGGVASPTIGPFLQWDAVTLNGRPFWYNRLQFDNLIPVGKYNKKYQMNPGTPFYAFSPYWSMTMFITSKWAITSRLYFIWSAKNQNTGIQAGKAINDNFSTSYPLWDNHVRIGVAGYYLKQLENSYGSDLENSKERVLGIGPGVNINFTPKTSLCFTYFTESLAENRTEGDRFVLSITQAFS